MSKKKSKKINVKVIVFSFIALGFVVLSVLVDWIFIAGALVMIYLNQKELVREC